MKASAILCILFILTGCAKLDHKAGVHYHWFDKKQQTEMTSSFDIDGLGQLKRLASSNAVPDAEAAFRSGEYWFAGTSGFSLSVPGLMGTNSVQNQEYREIIDQYGVRIISGTTDNMGNSLQVKISELARIYARIYNTRLLELMREKGLPSVEAAEGP